DRGREISLDHSPIPADGKLYAVFNVALDQHHPVRFAEPFCRTFPSIVVHLHLPDTESGFVEITLHRGALQDSRGYAPLQFQDIDDLTDRAFWDFPLQLDCLFQKLIEVFRELRGAFRFPVLWLQSGESALSVSRLIAVQGSRGQSVLFCDRLPHLDPFCIVQRFIQQGRDQLVPPQCLFFLPLYSFVCFHWYNLLCREGTTGQW